MYRAYLDTAEILEAPSLKIVYNAVYDLMKKDHYCKTAIFVKVNADVKIVIGTMNQYSANFYGHKQLEF